MDVLLHRVKDQRAVVFQLIAQIQTLPPEEISGQLLAHLSQIPGDDQVVI